MIVRSPHSGPNRPTRKAPTGFFYTGLVLVRAAGMSENPLVAMEGVSINLDGHIFFEGTNWTMHRGEHWAVVGPTASGKSLLAKALCREISLSRGTIRYFFDSADNPRSFVNRGEIIRVTPEAEAELRGAGRSYHQARWHSFEGSNSPRVGDLLTGESIERVSSYDITPLRRSRQEYERERKRVVALLGLESLMERKAFHLSHGEARKVLIARALMQSPEILVLDTPFGGLDQHSRRQLKSILERLLSKARPLVVLLTTREEDLPNGITHQVEVFQGETVQLSPVDRTLAAQTAASDQSISRPDIGNNGSPPVFEGFTSERRPVTPCSGGSAGNDALVELKGVSVRYGPVQVLADVTWTVCRGERWALLGPNGAGKSTLLSLILADNPQAYSNQVRLFGWRRGSGETIWDIKKRIGWVSPELQSHYPPTTGCRSVVESGLYDSIGLYAKGSAEALGRVEKLLGAIGIGHLGERPFGAVSTGEQRLVLLARAIIKEPELLILDEPGQGMDGPLRDRLKSFLETYCRSVPVTLIYVTHVPSEIPEVVEHTLRLDHGRVLRERDTVD